MPSEVLHACGGQTRVSVKLFPGSIDTFQITWGKIWEVEYQNIRWFVSLRI